MTDDYSKKLFGIVVPKVNYQQKENYGKIIDIDPDNWLEIKIKN